MTKRMSERVGRVRSVVGAALLLLALAPINAAPAATLPSAPVGLKFYTPPARLIPGRPGTLVWSRPVHTPAAMSGASSTTLVLYRARLPNGKPTVVSGLVFVPRGTAPKGGWKLVSWAHGTTGIADRCAPSRDAASSHIYPELNGWLKRGYAIAQTDYQGLGTPGVHLYLIGRAEGASVVDIALAARHIDPSIGSRFAIAGHSQGGQAALFAAAEAARDAPALTLVGVAAFAPASHITTQVKVAPSLTAPGGALSALGGLILTSAAAASPAVHLSALLTPPALALVPAVQRRCVGALASKNSWGGLAPAAIAQPGANTTALYRVLDAMNPALKIAAPVLMLQGTGDTTVFPAFTNMLDTELTGKGDKVDYRTFRGVTHGGIVVAGDAATTTWLAQRFR